MWVTIKTLASALPMAPSLWLGRGVSGFALQGTNISPKNGSFEDDFPFPFRWDMYPFPGGYNFVSCDMHLMVHRLEGEWMDDFPGGLGRTLSAGDGGVVLVDDTNMSANGSKMITQPKANLSNCVGDYRFTRKMSSSKLGIPTVLWLSKTMMWGKPENDP